MTPKDIKYPEKQNTISLKELFDLIKQYDIDFFKDQNVEIKRNSLELKKSYYKDAEDERQANLEGRRLTRGR